MIASNIPEPSSTMYKILIAGLLLAFSVLAHAELITGRVIGVADGDTITVLDNTNTQHKIRLAGIDAPERKQAFGNVSKKSLSDLVYGKQVTVDWQKQDRYGRTVGKVIINGMDANLEQIKRGMAWFYKRYESELALHDRREYAGTEEDAKQSRLGLWSDGNPTPPWDFRKQGRGKLSQWQKNPQNELYAYFLETNSNNDFNLYTFI